MFEVNTDNTETNNNNTQNRPVMEGDKPLNSELKNGAVAATAEPEKRDNKKPEEPINERLAYFFPFYRIKKQLIKAKNQEAERLKKIQNGDKKDKDEEAINNRVDFALMELFLKTFEFPGYDSVNKTVFGQKISERDKESTEAFNIYDSAFEFLYIVALFFKLPIEMRPKSEISSQKG